MTYKNLEIVILNIDIPEYGLKKGDSGTVVDVYEDLESYEVEFIKDNGKTVALLTLDSTEISPKPEINFKSHKSDKIINRSIIGDLPFSIYTYAY